MERKLRALLATNQTSTKVRNYGAIPLRSKVPSRTLSTGNTRRRAVKRQIQKELLKVTLYPEKALELAISIELGARNQLAIQAKHTSDPSMVSIVGRSDPVLAITSSRYRGNFRGNYSQPRGTFTQLRGNNNNNQSNRQQVQQNCRNCGQPWTQDHWVKCQAFGQTCQRCNKPNHLAKVCRSNLTRKNNRNVNEIEELHGSQHEDNINMVSLNNEIESLAHNSDED